MENKNSKIFILSVSVMAVWLVILTFCYLAISQKLKLSEEKTSALSEQKIVAVKALSSSESSSKVVEGINIFGNYTAEDFSSFDGYFISKNKEDHAITVIGYLMFGNEVIEKLGNQLPPQTPVEIRHIIIGKDTKIINSLGESLTIDDLASEDRLSIVPLLIENYAEPSFLASEILVTKKVWPEGENPFN
ncbi:hypothetical protein KJ671_01135 [Patescibacteria group bacterium]|nr:hypothetical protein [Patescibacteria group bacterium]